VSGVRSDCQRCANNYNTILLLYCIGQDNIPTTTAAGAAAASLPSLETTVAYQKRASGIALRPYNRLDDASDNSGNRSSDSEDYGGDKKGADEEESAAVAGEAHTGKD
jgi:hypothetical protein